MDEKRSFFASLQPKSAALVGAVTGVLVICTIGFFVLGAMALGGRLSLSNAKQPAEPAQASPAAEYNNTESVPIVVTKSDKPKVELFVMSYCPFGLQMEKAYMPAWQLLKNKADISVKFVNYAMHGLKEVEENTRQYCIQSEQSDKYLSYLNCFATSGDYQSCLSAAKVSTSKVDACVAKTNKQFGIMDKYNDQNTWLSGQFPQYPIYDQLNQKYSVQGSPTLVINGAQVQAGRTPEAVKLAICESFNNKPSECGQTLSSASPAAGFGAGTGQNTGNAGCGS